MIEPTLTRIVVNFHGRGSETAFIERHGYRTVRRSYREVAEFAGRFARELTERSIKPGDRILLWGRNCTEWASAFWGCVLCGAVVVPMDRAAPLEFVKCVCREAGVRLCVCSQEQPEVSPAIPAIRFECLQDLIARHSPLPLPVPASNPQDAVEIVFTSGTTADPKGVVLSHRNILANLEPLEKEIGKYLKYERIFHPLRFLNLLPLSHVFGQFLSLFVPQALGSTVVFQESLNPSEIIRTIKRERVSALVTVPKIMETLQAKIEQDLELEGNLQSFRRDLLAAGNRHPAWKWWRFRRIHSRFGWKFWALICGGARLNRKTEDFWQRLGFAVIQGYGLTETTSLVSVNHPLKPGKGSVGRVLPGREIKLSREGEILVRGESVAKSYCHAGKGEITSTGDGWFHTGDIGVLDDQGNLYFKGRQKNVIVSPEGMNIYPQDLESALRRQPEVVDCVVLGVEREEKTEPCAVVILKNTSQDPAPAIKRANDLLAGYQHIRLWIAWPGGDFPRTSTHKPNLKSIREYVDAQLPGTPGDHAQDGLFAGLVSRITGRNVQLSPESSLAADLDLNSIERVELLGALEDRFQVDINETRFTSASTIGDLEEMVREPAQKRTDFNYPRWPQRLPVEIVRILVYYFLSWPATLALSRPCVRGRENLRGLEGPVLFIANHVTKVDVGFVLAALPVRFRHRLAVAMIGEMLQEMRHPPPETSFWKRWMNKTGYGLVVALFNVFPLPQKTGFRRSFAFAGESMDRGYSVLVFPEGMRTKDGRLGPFRAGIGLMAKNLNVPVVPIRIGGLYELKKAGRIFAGPGAVTVNIGSAQRINRGIDSVGITRELERSFRCL